MTPLSTPAAQGALFRDLLAFAAARAALNPTFAKGTEKQVIADARALVARAAALSASPSPEALPASGVEAVMWQVRMRPTWDAASPWSPWRECTKECAERIASRSLSGDWEYEARALAPAALTSAPAPEDGGNQGLASARLRPELSSAEAQNTREYWLKIYPDGNFPEGV